MGTCRTCSKETPPRVGNHCWSCRSKENIARTGSNGICRPNTTCEICGKDFHSTPSRFAAGKHHYCCYTCKAEGHRRFGETTGARNGWFKGGPVEVACAICGTPTHRKACEVSKGRRWYCSTQCQHRGLSVFNGGSNHKRTKPPITIPCRFCGRPVTRQAWQFKKNAYCDRKCFSGWKSQNWNADANPAWRGGHIPYYGPNWRRQARRARARDNHRCRRCGVAETVLGRALDVHHIIRFGDFGDYRKANMLRNLRSYCVRCHKYVEKHGI